MDYLNRTLGTSFNDSVLRLAAMDWFEFNKLQHWQDALPYPTFTPQEIVIKGRHLGFPYFLTPGNSISLQRLQWDISAPAFFDYVKRRLNNNISTITHHIRTGIRQHELRLGHLIDLDADDLTEKLLIANNKHTVRDIFYLEIYDELIYPFVTEAVRGYLDVRLGVIEPVGTTPENSDKPKLTQRQVALLYAYSGQKIWPDNNTKIANQYGHTSGIRLQLEYNKVKDPTNRAGYESESKRVITAFIKDQGFLIKTGR